MIYVMGIEGSASVKIGQAEDPTKRVGALQTGTPHRLSLLWMHEGGQNLEGHLHATFSEYRVRGEWFDLTPLGEPVAAVQDAVANAPTRLLPAPKWTRSAAPNYSALQRRFGVRASGRVWQAPAGLPSAVPQERRTDWEQRFPPVVQATQPEIRDVIVSSRKGQDAQPGCIRAWQGECHRLAGTTCGC